MTTRRDPRWLDAHYWAEKHYIAGRVHELVRPVLTEAPWQSHLDHAGRIDPSQAITMLDVVLGMSSRMRTELEDLPVAYRPRFPTAAAPVTRLEVDLLRTIRLALDDEPDSTTSRPYVTWAGLSPSAIMREVADLMGLMRSSLGIASIAGRQLLDLPQVHLPTTRQLRTRKRQAIPDNVRHLHPLRRAHEVATTARAA